MHLFHHPKGQNLYHLFGVPLFSDLDKIKRGYREFALKYHPDRSPGSKNANKIFHLGTKAYKFLMNEETRLNYDRVLRKHLLGIVDLNNKDLIPQNSRHYISFFSRQALWRFDNIGSAEEYQVIFKEFFRSEKKYRTYSKIISKNDMNSDDYQCFIDVCRNDFREYLNSLPRISKSKS